MRSSFIVPVTLLLLSGSLLTNAAANHRLQNRQPPVIIDVQPTSSPRVDYAVSLLAGALKKKLYQVTIVYNTSPGNFKENQEVIFIAADSTRQIRSAAERIHVPQPHNLKSEGFRISAKDSRWLLVAGKDPSGILYGCMELISRIEKEGKIPRNINFEDHPEMKLRGACIGLQKPTLLPGRGTYEYPLTPGNFPWFYDKVLWTRYLDMLVSNKMNTLYLWSGHPFASLVRLKDYPAAVEVDSATFKKNQEMYRFLASEADKRGIWLIQAFYNIIVSKPFAVLHHLKTQDRNRPIIPVIADYTRKSIAAFVEQYPNVGLLVTLGEAMEGVGPDDTKWFTETIIPGVKDGLKALGKTTEPPIILRAHDTNAPEVIAASKGLYSNLFTMAKYNGEALTTFTPRGPWAQLHRRLSEIAPVQVENVHIMANLEPFRYGADDFIQKCVQAMHDIYGANGLHLYPQASYWDWPYCADRTDPRLLQIDRDWIWYAEWARYAWNCHRNRQDEVLYWSEQLAAKYGCGLKAAKKILTAYEQSGEIAPKLLRRYGITDGNRQTLSLGMFMSQLIDPARYGLFTLLYNSEGPPGEMITEYARKEWNHQRHTGETPVMVAAQVVHEGQHAVTAINSASGLVKKNVAEFNRLKNDMECYNQLAVFYSEKVKSALEVLRYRYSDNLQDLKRALPYLEESVRAFSKLARLGKDTYLYANSMQTGARKIPMSSQGGKNTTWQQLLPHYQMELANFKKNLRFLQLHHNELPGSPRAAFKNAPVALTGTSTFDYILQKGATPFPDTASAFGSYAACLGGLRGVSFEAKKQAENGTSLDFKNDQPVFLLVGFFASKDKKYLKEPELETDASANDYGQAETKIANALNLPGFPAVNVHSYYFGPGHHHLQLAKGVCLVLGFVNGNTVLRPFDAAIGKKAEDRDLDWLFN